MSNRTPRRTHADIVVLVAAFAAFGPLCAPATAGTGFTINGAAAQIAIVADVGAAGGMTIACQPYPAATSPVALPAPAPVRPAGAIPLPRATTPLPLSFRFPDAAGRGFNDATLGEQRRAALKTAADLVANQLPGSVAVVIEARMESLPPRTTGLVIAGQARPASLHANFAGAPLADTAYPAALANQLVVPPHDLNGTQAEVVMSFNLDLDEGNVLNGAHWDYGTDGVPSGDDVDFVSVALHELVHGLGFASLVVPAAGCAGGEHPGLECTTNADCGTGTCANLTGALGQPSVFDRHLVQHGAKALGSMTDTERGAAIESDNVFFEGPAVALAITTGAKLFASPPTVSGTCAALRPASSRLSHWDPLLMPPQLMAPVLCTPVHEPGLALPALVDLGWVACLDGHPSGLTCRFDRLENTAHELLPIGTPCPPRSRNPIPRLVAKVRTRTELALGAITSGVCKIDLDVAVMKAGDVKRALGQLARRRRLCVPQMRHTVAQEVGRLQVELHHLRRVYCDSLPDTTKR